MSETAIRDVFIAEAREIIESLESDIVKLEENEGDKEIINGIFRYIHTLKGSSGITGMTTVYEFTHSLENLLDDVRSDQIKADRLIIDLLLDGVDWIKNEIFTDEAESDASVQKKNLLLERIVDLRGGNISSIVPESKKDLSESPPVSRGEKYYKLSINFKDDIFEYGIDPLTIIEDLFSLGEIIVKNVLKTTLPPLDEMDPEKCYLGWDIIIKTDKSIDEINDVFLFVSDDNDISIEDVTSSFQDVTSEQTYLQEKKIGEILCDKGIITGDELEEIVTSQSATQKRFGDIVVEKGYASESEVSDALQEQDTVKKKIELTTIRVDTGKLDNLLNLLGEIVIGQSSLSGLAEELDDERGFQLKNVIFALDRTTREFQEQIMSIRMVPIGPTFEQFRRFVRDSAHSRGKETRLEIEGGDTELDKTVIEKIGDPLKHMIRNAIDHGIETPEERKKAGKNVSGKISLKSYHQEGSIYIEIIDDGKGIDLKRIREKAESRGIIKPDEDVSRDKLMSFLFLPAFSTAESIGDLSGRGVGMDVVKTNIEELRGNVEIRSVEGSGTTIRIKLPLTLAIIDGMMVRVGNNIYIIPLLSVLESIQPSKEDVKTVEGTGEVILVRDEYISLVRLYDLFEIESDYTNPWESLVVIVESGTTRVGIMIDDLLGQQQIVIKSLDSFISDSRALAGAAIMGDGKVALILDIHGLVEDINKADSRGGRW